jgi:hypothetical protein
MRFSNFDARWNCGEAQGFSIACPQSVILHFADHFLHITIESLDSIPQAVQSNGQDTSAALAKIVLAAN